MKLLAEKTFMDRSKSLRERMHEYLNYVASFYTSENRANGEYGFCIYSATKTSPGCAIGQCLPETVALDLDDVDKYGTGISISEIWGDVYFSWLPTWMKDFGVDFLTELQYLHDSKNFWDKNGMTVDGERHYNIVQRNINRGYYD